MLPSFANLSVDTIGPHATKRPRRQPQAEETDAQQLYDKLGQATSIEKKPLPPEWFKQLSDAQFDMLLAARLYTGPIYRYMVMTPNEEHIRDTTEDGTTRYRLPDLPERTTDFETAAFFAMVSAHRRQPSAFNALDCELLREMVEDYGDYFTMDEPTFRDAVHKLLVDRNREGTAVFWQLPYLMRTKMEMQKKEDYLAEDPNYPDTFGKFLRKGDNGFDDVYQAYKTGKQLSRAFFWSGMESLATNLETFIRESGNIVGLVPMKVYRGLREEASNDRLEGSFSSVTIDESVARQYTTDPELEGDGDIDSAQNVCCMLRIKLNPGTPYLDTMVLSNSGGWGFALADKELILPPGLTWDYDARIQSLFPPEIDESTLLKDDEEIEMDEYEGENPFDDPAVTVDTRNYHVEYYEVS